jgi:ATP-binding cassette subfamily B protein
MPKPPSQIQAALDDLMRRRTCTAFVVAQRISTVRTADRILLMDKGDWWPRAPTNT